MKPIFFAWTRSFWAGALAILSSLDGILPLLIDPQVQGPISQLVGHFTGYDVQGLVAAATPLLTFFALQQRSGSARPYTIDPRAIK